MNVELRSSLISRPRVVRDDARRSGPSGGVGDLKSAVLGALVHSGYAALRSVGCEVSGGRVTLVGAVPTYHLKQLAQVFAQRVDGVQAVQNRIAVFG